MPSNTKDIKWLQWCVDGARIFSTCAKKQYMCIIVDRYGYVNATGYNGVPSGFVHCDTGGCPRYVNDVPSGTPYDFGEGLCYSQHSETNALAAADKFKIQGGVMYVNGFPCFDCAKGIVNAGLHKLVYLEEDFLRVGAEETWGIFEKADIIVEGIKL